MSWNTMQHNRITMLKITHMSKNGSIFAGAAASRGAGAGGCAVSNFMFW
jgi:hypothetical protein